MKTPEPYPSRFISDYDSAIEYIEEINALATEVVTLRARGAAAYQDFQNAVSRLGELVGVRS